MSPFDNMSKEDAAAFVHTMNFFTAVMLEHGGSITVKSESLARATQLNETSIYRIQFDPAGTTGTITFPDA